MLTVDELAQGLWSLRPATGTFIIGVTGGVACGKSTLAGALAVAFGRMPERPAVECAGTDGFLYANSVLSARGLLERKGFPETYDRAALVEALTRARTGPAAFPGYSHSLYDIDPALTRILDRPEVLVVEGLGLDRAIPVDLLVYLEAERCDQEAWYVERFIGFWETARDDAGTFYARFRDLDRTGVARLASAVWTQVNLPNLEAHIEPVRATADMIVSKGADHAIRSITRPGAGADRGGGRS